MTARFQRFAMPGPVSVIVKNERSRCACFWFSLANVSASGVGLEFRGFGYIPFSVGDTLQLTIDTSSVIFSRPIHLKVIVRRRDDSQVAEGDAILNKVFLGAEIQSTDALHQSVWMDGLTSLGDPFKVDMIKARGNG